MKADELLLTLFRNGVSLTVEDDSLHYFAEKEISGELLQEIREHKAELIQVLRLLQHFGGRVGETIATPDGDGIVWGVCGYGVEVMLPGKYVVLCNPTELALLNNAGATL